MISRRTIIVQKTRVMIADDLADALKAKPWERGALKRLSLETLTLMAASTIPAWKPHVEVPA